MSPEAKKRVLTTVTKPEGPASGASLKFVRPLEEFTKLWYPDAYDPGCVANQWNEPTVQRL